MDSNPWEEVIDELYEMGGYGEWWQPENDPGIDDDVDLLSRTGLEADELESITDRLESSGLVHEEPLYEPTPTGGREITSIVYYGVGLTEAGFSLAHDRRAEKRNHESNRSIIILTLALALMGLSQATALTIQSGSTFALGVLAGAAIVLLAVYIRLFQKGIIDI